MSEWLAELYRELKGRGQLLAVVVVTIALVYLCVQVGRVARTVSRVAGRVEVITDRVEDITRLPLFSPRPDSDDNAFDDLDYP